MTNIYNTNLTNIGQPNNYTITNGATLSYGSTWSNNINPIMTVKDGSNALEVKGKLVINGLDLEERLKTIEKVLMIPERDATMEAKYPSLKKKYEEYINDLSKYRMWESLKGNEND